MQLQCLFTTPGQTEQVSNAITIDICRKNSQTSPASDLCFLSDYVYVTGPPSTSAVKNEVVHLTVQETSYLLQLNCSELMTENPLPSFNWVYNNSLTANITERGFRHSVLTVAIDSREQVSELLSSGNVLCIASNELGSTNKSFSFSLAGRQFSIKSVIFNDRAVEGNSCACSCAISS